FVEVDRAADAAFDVRDVLAAVRCDHHRAQMEQRDRGAATDAEHALLDAQEAVVAIEHERAAQRAEQEAGADREHTDRGRPQRRRGDEPTAESSDRPAGPAGASRDAQLDPRARTLANLYGAEPVEHDQLYQAGGRL